MKTLVNSLLATSVALPLMAQAAVSPSTVIDFEDLALNPESYFDPDVTTTFESRGATFEHNAPYGACCWSGFTYSNSSDTTTPGFSNDYSAYPGTGFGGEGNYGVAYTDGARFTFGSATNVEGAQFANTTYTYLAIADGNDGNAVPFVKGPFEEGDFFEITVHGLNAAGDREGSVSFLLGDGADIVSDWMWVELSGLGEVFGLEFTFASSDTGQFGVNTPTYFAIDNITTSEVPVPAAAWLFGSALLGLMGARRCK